jgi:hypothetical protein
MVKNEKARAVLGRTPSDSVLNRCPDLFFLMADG